jgi:hypothetical protein
MFIGSDKAHETSSCNGGVRMAQHNKTAFKESTEKLQLQLAAADQVDRPILLPVPFTATIQGGVQ